MTLDVSDAETQKLADEFHMIIGYCISEWSNIEDELFQVCWRVLRSAPEHAAIVYYRTPNIDARLTLVSELVRSVLPPRDRPSGGHDHADVKLWQDIENKLRALLRTRNRIAHHPVTPTYRIHAEDLTDFLRAEMTVSVSGRECLFGRDNSAGVARCQGEI